MMITRSDSLARDRLKVSLDRIEILEDFMYHQILVIPVGRPTRMKNLAKA